MSPESPPWCEDRPVVVDVSYWSKIRREDGGRDERKWWLAADPDAERSLWWLWKPVKPTGRDNWRTNDAAEVVAHHLARAIGLPSAPCRYAVRNGERGVISRNISPHLHEMASGAAWGADEEEYTVERVLAVLDRLTGPPPAHAHLSAGQVFAGYLILDAWIANTDRHEENWAVVEPPQGTPYLAPTFDHGSALGSGMTDENRERRNRRSFCEQGRSRAFGKRSLLDLACEAVDRTETRWWADRVAIVQASAWTGILEDHGGLSDVSRSFMSDVLTINQERVSNVCRP